MRKFLLFTLAILLAVPIGIWVSSQVAPKPTLQFLLGLERTASGLSEHEVEIPGFRIRYLAGGDGEPLLLLHGFAANKDNWTRIAKHLTPHYRVIAPDLPGFGESSKPSGATYRYADQIPRLQQFMQALGHERYHVGGNSMGGYFSAGLASTYPASVQSAWLLAPGGVHSAEPSEMTRRIAAGDDVPLMARTPAEFRDVFAFVMTEPPWVPDFYLDVLAERAVAANPLNAKIFEQIRLQSPALEDEVDGLSTPMLIHWGEQDRVLHVSGADVLAPRLPNAEIIRLPGIGHMPMLEAEKRVASDYLAFREQLTPGATTDE